MKIILSKDDIIALVGKYYNMEALGWNDDGGITMDTTLEKILNGKNNLQQVNNLLKKSPFPDYMWDYTPQKLLNQK